MAASASVLSLSFLFLISFGLVGLSHAASECSAPTPLIDIPIFPTDIDLLQFALNLEHMEADWFLYGALGYGLDAVAPELVMGGPPPIGATKANLDNVTSAIMAEFGYQEVGHLRAIKSTVGGFPRPVIDLSGKHFAKIFDDAFGFHLDPPFDPYLNSVNYLLASYVIPYVGLVGYVGANPNINVIRTLLYERANEVVQPYKNLTVAEFTAKVSELRNKLASCGVKDEGLLVPVSWGAENKTNSNVLSANVNSVAYKRTPAEILRIVYGTGDEGTPGGFLPKGGDGAIARGLLKFA
ncbi:desiccation-related protein [Musa troglodytarum]|uniref:Desiccation-related protein n=1 Tax=Musa troglodytarum TaxID=320322 RepID=A0A9E7EV54_9LILI|nr:desiccation-related protein [Musa troglodytarum]